MHLVKVKDGLVEEDNFFLTSPIEDFLGNGELIRKDKSFTIRNGSVERKIDRDKFVIVVDKDINPLAPEDRLEFFLSDGCNKAGISESDDVDYSKYWKLIYYDDYIQGYSSDDGLKWKNVGGKRLENVGYQGFYAKGNDLVLNSYKLYRNPYITVQNFFPGIKVRLLDRDNKVIKERLFQDNYECKIFLDYPIIGKLQFIDGDNLIYETNLISFKYGDIFMFTKYKLELFYKERLLTYRTTTLDGLLEVLVLRNASDVDYEDITLKLNNPNSDDIEISLDNELFNDDYLVIDELKAGEEVDIYVKITKDRSEYFKMNDFTLDIY